MDDEPRASTVPRDRELPDRARPGPLATPASPPDMSLRGGAAVAAGAGRPAASAAAPPLPRRGRCPRPGSAGRRRAAGAAGLRRRRRTSTIAKVLDFYEAVYERADASADLFSEPLVRLDQGLRDRPGRRHSSGRAAKTARPGPSSSTRTWSGATATRSPPTTGCATFRYAADPEHAWDFTWFFQGVIKNWTRRSPATVPPDQIGVRSGADDYELVFETVDRRPVPAGDAALLAAALGGGAGRARAALQHQPETAVSSGPFILTEWVQDQRIVYERNPTYKGTLQVPVSKVIVKLAAPDDLLHHVPGRRGRLHARTRRRPS